MMKKINIIKSYTAIVCLLLFTVILSMLNGCTPDRGAGWADERYLTNFEYYFDNPNPKTGVAYTEEELAALDYDPSKEGKFEEGDPVVLSFVLPKQLKNLSVTNTVNGDELYSFTEAQPDGDKFRINISTTLPELGLLELKDKIFLKFDFNYLDGAQGSVIYKITYVKIEVIDPNADLSKNLVGYWRFNDPNNLGKATIGNDLIIAGAGSHSAIAGINAEDGAALVDTESWYEVDHGMPAVGGSNVNTYTMIWDVKVSAADLGKYIDLLQTNTANDSDGPVYIDPDGGFWFNGGASGFGGTIQADTWHRIVLAVDAPEVRFYVDGVEIYTNDLLASKDGIFSLDLSKFIIFGDNSGASEDNPIGITEFMLFDTAFAGSVIQSFPAVTEPAIPSITQSLVGRWKFDAAADLTKANCGNDLVIAGAGSHSAVAGVNVEDGAALVDIGSWYEVDHGMPAVGGANVNTYTMIWDVKVAAADLGKYIDLLQTNTANDSDGPVYIDPNGGFWFNGGASGFSGTIQADTWHRIVLAVDAPEVRFYVDGVEIYTDDLLASVDGIFSLDLAKFIIFGDNSGTSEDNPISITDFLLFDKALSKATIEGLPTVDTVLF
ncbi:LamG domain-containing protein [Aestuariivivens insulae]|uniref:LamG domain-containing protein n=1 Tax=Aestuariivivens insulae TaxID=1621988 RepID=UPI001F5853C9|nr:LamG domain-containing protein [Aestuariivivens insulae]